MRSLVNGIVFGGVWESGDNVNSDYLCMFVDGFISISEFSTTVVLTVQVVVSGGTHSSGGGEL